MSPGSGASVLRLLEARRPADEAATASTPELLCLGGDGRIALDGERGLNRYGCAPTPDEARVAFGSSTASTISPRAFAAAERLRRRLAGALAEAAPHEVYEAETDRVRAELLGLYGLAGRGVEAVLAPSGTDLHHIAGRLVAAGGPRPLAIICEETETGSGVPCALGGDPGDVMEVRAVAARGEDGRPRDPAQADAEVEALTTAAAREGRPVMIVLIDVSKTGLISPSPEGAFALAERFAGRVTVLVDACQLRLSGPTIAAYLDRGAMVAVTGSKFLTGPAFSAALLIPPLLARRFEAVPAPAPSPRGDWPRGWAARESLPAKENFGLLVRWEAALEELRGFASVSDAQIGAVAAALGRVAEAEIAAHPELEPLEVRPLDRGRSAVAGWDAHRTIFPFLMRAGAHGPWLTREQTQRAWRLMLQDLGSATASQALPVRAAARLKIEVGQPVCAGVRDGAPVAALRLCLGARLVCEAASGDPGAAARLLSDARLAVAKAAWLAREVAAGRL